MQLRRLDHRWIEQQHPELARSLDRTQVWVQAQLRNEIQRRGCLLATHLYWERVYEREGLRPSRPMGDRTGLDQIAARNGMALLRMGRTWAVGAFSPEMVGLC